MAKMRILIGVLVGLVLTLNAKGALAQSPFDKFSMSRSAPKYLVLKDVNVRLSPKTKSKRLGRLRKGVTVTAVGKAKGTEWVGVRKDGKDFGFVYGTALAPMIDGALEAPIKGALVGKDRPNCKFTIKFEEKFKVEGDNQVTSDYLAPWECQIKKRTIKFQSSMFITELPYLDIKKEIYQINVDLLGLPMEEEDILSATILYHPNRKKLTFVALSNKEMRGGAKIIDLEVNSVPEALKGAIGMAYRAWGKKLWAELEKIK